MSSSLEKTSTSSTEDYADLQQQQQQLQLRRGPWTLEEDSLLIHYIALHGEGRWNLLTKRAGLRRTGKSCRLRWLNYLKPDVKRGNLTAQEQFLILQLHSKWGNRWSKIAQNLPGRTDNEIKNYWRTRVQKQARHLKIEVNSAAFQNVIKCFWMPRLLQKIEGSSSVSSMASTDSTLPQTYHHQPSQTFQHTLPGQVHIGDLSEAVVHNFDCSDSDHCGSSCVSSSESMNNNNNQNISSVVSQFAEYQTSPNLSIIGNHGYGCYDMENISQLASTSALGDEFVNLVSDCHVAENDWVADADGLWSMDELWELRNLD